MCCRITCMCFTTSKLCGCAADHMLLGMFAPSQTSNQGTEPLITLCPSRRWVKTYWGYRLSAVQAQYPFMPPNSQVALEQLQSSNIVHTLASGSDS
jgi:hypothetical protein